MRLTRRTAMAPVAVAIVHLPPPLHGLSRASQAVVEELKGAAGGAVAVSDISPHSGRGVWSRLARLPLVVRAAAALVRHRRCGRLYLACEGGEGVAFTALLLELAGRLGYTVYLHHHSLAHVRSPHGRLARHLASAVRRHRSAIVHIGACAGMVDEIADAYGTGTRVFVLPLHQMSDVLAPSTRRERTGSRLVLGHMGNLTEAKGLGLAFDLLEAGVSAGLDLELIVAGPAWAPSDRALLDRRLAQAGTRARWVGPVTGASKEAFFEAIDVFVFPSRYEHESFAIVVAEAQASGAPVLAYKAGCLDTAVFGAGVLSLPSTEEFVPVALVQLRTWAEERRKLVEDGAAAAIQARANRRVAVAGLTNLAAEIVALG